MKKLLHTLTHIGVSEHLDSREARRIVCVNTIALLTSLYIMTRVIFSLSNIVYSLNLFSMNFFVVSVLVLNLHRKYQAAKVITFSAWVAGVTFFTYFYLGGFHGGAFVLLFSAVLWPFMLFDHEQNKVTIVVLLGGLILCFALLITLQYVHPLSVAANIDMDFVRISTTILALLILLLLTWYFHSSNLIIESRLRKEKEKSEKAKDAAEAASRAKSAFLANMSHELRTPLNAILGFSELMQRDPGLSMQQRQNLETIGRSGEHLLSLINDVLEFSKIESGRSVLNPEDFDLHRLLLGIEEMFGLHAKRKGIALEFSCAQGVPQYIHADQNKLRQILINLLGNAVKFTETGGVRLSVEGDPDQGDKSEGARLCFEITDTGCGISKPEQGRIFQAFYQSKSRLSSQQGTGLGLPISRKFASLMGGVLDVSSEFGKGTTFTFSIPIEPARSTDMASQPLGRRVIGLAAGQPIFRLLVVEDNDSNRNLLVSLLQSVGFEVKEAVNGQDAVAKWHKWQPHMIWMDIRMPVMDGHQATAIIRSEMKRTNSETDTKIIALTANAFEEERFKVIEHGGNDFIRKPFREMEIFEMIHKHLGVRYLFSEKHKPLDIRRCEVKIDKKNLIRSLGNLPENLISMLEEGLELSDSSMIDEIIEKIRILDASLAEALSTLAMDFAYDRILDLVRNHETCQISTHYGYAKHQSIDKEDST